MEFKPFKRDKKNKTIKHFQISEKIYNKTKQFNLVKEVQTGLLIAKNKLEN